jgi:hypothetical protein
MLVPPNARRNREFDFPFRCHVETRIAIWTGQDLEFSLLEGEYYYDFGHAVVGIIPPRPAENTFRNECII